MLRILDQHRGDLFSPETIDAYFREVYWRKSEQGLDRHAVMEQFRVAPAGTDFAFRTVAERFRLIESGMEPVIVAMEQEPQAILRALKGAMPPGLAARKLQNYIVQVPPKDRSKLIENGHVKFVDGFFTGAWIETNYTTGTLWPALVASFTGAWIETFWH